MASIRGIKNYLNTLLEILLNLNKYKRNNISIISVFKLVGKSIGRYKLKILGNEIIITSPYWHLFGIKEIFFDEAYKFNSHKKTPYIIDCGANVGLSIIYFKKLFVNAEILAFEPDPFIFDILKKNIEKFSYNNITLCNTAIWKSEEELLFVSDKTVGGHLDFINNISTNDKIKIKTKRLYNFLDRNVDFLKIDIEGAEYEVIKDCKDRLNNVVNLFIEYHSITNQEQQIGELLLILKKSGFRVYIKEAWNNSSHPFLNMKKEGFDLQLNIFASQK